MDKEEKNIFQKILQWMYNRVLDGIILVAFTLVFFGAVGVYLYNVFRGQTPPAGGELLVLLGVVLTILGLGGAAIYLWIYGKVKEQIQRDLKQDQALAKSAVSIALGRTSMKLYRTLYQEKTLSEDSSGKAKEQIDEALHFANKAIEQFKTVNASEYPREQLIIKNNLAYYLARKWNYYRAAAAESDAGFKKYLEVDNRRAIEYLADKSTAEGCIADIKSTKDLEKFQDVVKNFEDTAVWVKKVFSVEPKPAFPKRH